MSESDDCDTVAVCPGPSDPAARHCRGAGPLSGRPGGAAGGAGPGGTDPAYGRSAAGVSSVTVTSLESRVTSNTLVPAMIMMTRTPGDLTGLVRDPAYAGASAWPRALGTA